MTPRDSLRQIMERQSDAGQSLPTELTLANELGLSRPALRELLSELEADGLLSRRRGSTTQINGAALQLRSRLDHHQDYAELLAGLGHKVTLEILSAELTTTVGHGAHAFSADPCEQTLRIRKRWRAGEQVAMVAIDYLALPASQTTIPDGLHRTVFDLVEALHGEAIEWTITHPRAELVTAEIADVLELAEGSAMMSLKERGLTRSGRHLWSSIEWHRPDIVDYSIVRVIV